MLGSILKLFKGRSSGKKSLSAGKSCKTYRTRNGVTISQCEDGGKNCGEVITTEAIDDQLRRWEPERQRIMEEEKKSGLVSTLGTIGVVAAAGLMWGVSLFLGKKRG